MPCAAVLELDPKAAARVDRLSRRLERELGIATERQRGAPVHVSLAVYRELPVEQAEAAMRHFVAGIAPMAIELAGIGAFPGRRTSSTWRRSCASRCWPHGAGGTACRHITRAPACRTTSRCAGCRT